MTIDLSKDEYKNDLFYGIGLYTYKLWWLHNCIKSTLFKIQCTGSVDDEKYKKVYDDLDKLDFGGLARRFNDVFALKTPGKDFKDLLFFQIKFKNEGDKNKISAIGEKIKNVMDGRNYIQHHFFNDNRDLLDARLTLDEEKHKVMSDIISEKINATNECYDSLTQFITSIDPDFYKDFEFPDTNTK